MTRLFRQHFMKCAMLLCALFTTLSVCAVPAKPGLKRIITLANGTQVEARLVGDEFGHYWLAEDGKAYVETTTNGLYAPTNLSTLQAQASQKRMAANQKRTNRMAARKARGNAAFTGQKKGIIILVNYADVEMDDNNNQALWNRVANEENFSYGNFKGSVRDYFYDQSDWPIRWSTLPTTTGTATMRWTKYLWFLPARESLTAVPPTPSGHMSGTSHLPNITAMGRERKRLMA